MSSLGVGSVEMFVDGKLIHTARRNTLSLVIDKLLTEGSEEQISVGTKGHVDHGSLPITIDTTELLKWVLPLYPEQHNEPWRKQNKWGGVSQKKRRKLARSK